MQHGLLANLQNRITNVASIELDDVLSLLQDFVYNDADDECFLTHGMPFSSKNAYSTRMWIPATTTFGHPRFRSSCRSSIGFSSRTASTPRPTSSTSPSSPTDHAQGVMRHLRMPSDIRPLPRHDSDLAAPRAPSPSLHRAHLGGAHSRRPLQRHLALHRLIHPLEDLGFAQRFCIP